VVPGEGKRVPIAESGTPFRRLLEPMLAEPSAKCDSHSPDPLGVSTDEGGPGGGRVESAEQDSSSVIFAEACQRFDQGADNGPLLRHGAGAIEVVEELAVVADRIARPAEPGRARHR
jgi:hypothetical protein